MDEEMTVQYNTKKCDEWLNSLKFSSIANFLEKVSVLIYERYTTDVNAFSEFVDDDLHGWVNFSLWERQYIIFKLAPICESYTEQAAKEVANRARIEEPL
jgi:hypothetical protein